MQFLLQKSKLQKSKARVFTDFVQERGQKEFQVQCPLICVKAKMNTAQPRLLLRDAAQKSSQSAKKVQKIQIPYAAY